MLYSQFFVFLFLGVLVVVFIGVGIYFILRSRTGTQKSRQSMNWPSVTGKVLETRLIESTSIDSDGNSRSTYRPYIRYEYEVDDVPYTNDKIDMGMVVSTSSTKKAKETLSRFSLGSSVLVYVNPNDPTDAILEQKASTSGLLIIGFALLVTGLCLILPIAIFLLVSYVWSGQ